MHTNDMTPTPARGRRRLRHIGGVLLMTAFLVAGASACQPAGCATNCITIVAINPGANQVSLYTTVNTFGTIEIFDDAAMTQLAVKKSDSNITTAHAMTIQQLDPNTQYWWRATAIDTSNQTRTNVGSFHTAIRTVTVTLNHIHLTDDSDALGDGEMAFHLGINGQTFLDAYDNEDMSSGTSVDLNYQQSITAPSPTLTIQLEGYDDDCTSQLCVGGLGADFGHGTTSEADWATGSFGPVAIPTFNTSGNWSVSTESYKVKFEATGTYQVTYTDAP